jgi:glycerate dehydrogenase
LKKSLEIWSDGMVNTKAKVVILQGDPMGIDLTYKDMVNRWIEGLNRIPEISNYCIVKNNVFTSEEYHQVIGDADAVLGLWISSKAVNEALFMHHPNLKYIATLGHGYEEFDIELTKRYGVTLANTIYGDVTIAQYAMSLLLSICNHVSLQSDYTKNGYWEDKENNQKARYNKLLAPQIELYEKTIGIIGLGAIGLCVANMAKSFGMKVIAYNRSKKVGKEYEGIEQVSFDDILSRSDVISIHCPYTKETDKMMNEEAFAKMKEGVILINTARGGIIDEAALLEALNKRKVYMAGLDVITTEPPKERNPLMESPYTYITSHIAWLPRTSRLRAIDVALENYVAFLHGKPKSVINK